MYRQRCSGPGALAAADGARDLNIVCDLVFPKQCVTLTPAHGGAWDVILFSPVVRGLRAFCAVQRPADEAIVRAR